MQSGLRIGRFGPLTINLHYTWLFIAVLLLWWAGLVWLPDNYPLWSRVYYWLVAVAVLLLFGLSVIAHELVHTAVGGTGPRNVSLFPFGAAVPFRVGQIEPGRLVLAALAGIVFSTALGGILVVIAGALPEDGIMGGVKATLTLLGWLNLALAAINLIPGTPFDGGWTLAGAMQWLSNEYEGGLRTAQWLGGMATLALVLVGAWLGLTSSSWLLALALVVLGWASSQATEIGRERSVVRTMLDQLKVREFMEPIRPAEAVSSTGTVADFMREHPNYPAAKPLPVLDPDGTLAGITTVGDGDDLLQGTWPTTPIRAITTPISSIRTIAPEDSIPQVLAVGNAIESEESASRGEVVQIPVVQDGTMVGRLDPGVLDAFQAAGRQFGLDETVPQQGDRRLRGLRAFLTIAFVLALAAILGNIALRTDPDELRDAVTDPDEGPVVLSNFFPAENQIVGFADSEISVEVTSTLPVISATISLDGEPLETTTSGDSPLARKITAPMQGLTLGVHTARVIVQVEGGARTSDSWQFRVSSTANQSQPTPPAEVTPTPGAGGATPGAGGPVSFGGYSPPPGGLVPAGEAGTLLGAEVRSAVAPLSATLLLNGRRLPAPVEPVAGSSGLYRVGAPGPLLTAGTHTARLEVRGADGSFSSADWSFSAIVPDEDNAYFPETGIFVSQPFLRYWQENGGLGRFGYPISGIVRESGQGDEETYPAQYFERARFELHEATGDQVVLGLLGTLVQEPEPAVQPKEGARFFPETGHNLAGPFLAYWEANGGLPVFGFPITEERVEENPIDGKEYTVQYFERNRFELHPEFAGTPNEVQLGLLGRQVWEER